MSKSVLEGSGGGVLMHNGPRRIWVVVLGHESKGNRSLGHDSKGNRIPGHDSKGNRSPNSRNNKSIGSFTCNCK